jgi:hypothetical protein
VAGDPPEAGGGPEGVKGTDRVGILAALNMGQKSAARASNAAVTFVEVGQLTGALGLVAIASKSNTTVPTNQRPANRRKLRPNPIPKAVGSATPWLAILMPRARNEPSKRQLQIAAPARQKR